MAVILVDAPPPVSKIVGLPGIVSIKATAPPSLGASGASAAAPVASVLPTADSVTKYPERP